jgi:hypothetical protein
MFAPRSHALKKISVIILTASIALGSALSGASTASAMPLAGDDTARTSDVVPVRQDGKPSGWNGHPRRDDRYWRNHRRHDSRDWNRRRHWDNHHDRDWDRHHRRHNGVTIRF